MKTYLASLRYQLASLHRFSGRDSVNRFWAWAGTVLCALFLGFGIAASRIMASWLEHVERFARDHPELVTRSVGPGHYSVQIKGDHPELMPDLGSFIGLTVAFMIVAIVLLGASLARRLHDTGRSGLLALLPVPFLASALWFTPRLIGSWNAAPDLRLSMLLFANNIVYLASVALLVFFTTKSGTPGSNHFGSPPA